MKLTIWNFSKLKIYT